MAEFALTMPCQIRLVWPVIAVSRKMNALPDNTAPQEGFVARFVETF